MSDGVRVLEGVGLTRSYRAGGRRVAAVRDVSLALERGETLALVGASGAGKSTLGRLLLLLERCDGGRVRWNGVAVDELRGRARRILRRRFQPVFQNPHASLHPRMTAFKMLGEVIRQEECLRGAALARRVGGLLELVGLSVRFEPRLAAELSGGEAQRLAIARALAARPQALVLDEPFSALDPVASAALANRLLDWQQRAGIALLFITHDLGIVGHLADRVAVMEGGALVETGPAEQILAAPRHEVTRALLAAVPGQALFSRSASTRAVAAARG
ncbi:MAG: ATP-binding cassette domain-containing protein [Planctomycetes bacterium]|nr:ATP-binding cassette domain-containing protein [Planctomycetota bacterium]